MGGAASLELTKRKKDRSYRPTGNKLKGQGGPSSGDPPRRLGSLSKKDATPSSRKRTRSVLVRPEKTKKEGPTASSLRKARSQPMREERDTFSQVRTASAARPFKRQTRTWALLRSVISAREGKGEDRRLRRRPWRSPPYRAKGTRRTL